MPLNLASAPSKIGVISSFLLFFDVFLPFLPLSFPPFPLSPFLLFILPYTYSRTHIFLYESVHMSKVLTERRSIVIYIIMTGYSLHFLVIWIAVTNWIQNSNSSNRNSKERMVSSISNSFCVTGLEILSLFFFKVKDLVLFCLFCLVMPWGNKVYFNPNKMITNCNYMICFSTGQFT